MSRPETGVLQFGDDWPGVFIRGDDAYGYSTSVEHAVLMLQESARPDAVMTLHMLRGLDDLLKSCDIRLKRTKQVLRPFDDCATEKP